ncbi:M16 family metallopeptidase [Mucilaginibacter sp.]|uniref:M16 family metallopeptidase n=1 Tax=Mucilaginibacter sp. TaxID=1882438 RepID=UPI000CBCEAEF|nr:M16 family metallopeptidase [Mucilaginibacter sp.]PLW88996.1 MAG: peptidase M16 [Mucilaginibacter sp.]HEK20943.1 insulinase family protein [Bacteroidota bacterium]
MNFNKTLSVAALALVIAYGHADAQIKKRPQPSPRNRPVSALAQLGANPLPVDKDVIIGKLPNGLTYYIRHNEQPQNRAELYLVNKVGSILETDAQQGLAHFTEHMAFNGTRDFPKNDLINYLQKSGVRFGADLNAYTSFDETVYQLPLPTDSAAVFANGFKILANWAGRVTFDPSEIDKERGVVLEEERLRGKNAQERLSQQTLPTLLNNSRYATRLPIGKEDILKTFTPETIKSFYHDWYRPDLQAVIAVGDFDVKKVEALIKANFSDLKNPTPEKPRAEYTVPPSPGTAVKVATDKEFPYMLAQIIVRHPQIVIKTDLGMLQGMRVQLFNYMLAQRISELQQKPEPPFLYARLNYGGFLGKMDAFTAVVVGKPDAFEKAVKAVAAETERARKFGFTSTEFERAKQAALVGIQNAYYERDKTNSANYVREYQQNFLKGEGIPGIEYEYNYYVSNMNKVNLEEVNAMAKKLITDQNRVIIVEGPEKDKDKLPDDKTILNWVNTAGNGVTAYVDNVTSKPLMEKAPEPGKIVSETQNDALGTTTLTLSNGIKVILKPTEFKNDQILLNGFAPGGTSLASDNDYTSASLAAAIIGSSGISEFNQGMLDKMLSDKNVDISPYITEITEGVRGSFSPRDLQTAMQLVYLYFTQPRKDADIWQGNINQTKALLANRGLDPGSVYQDTLSAVLSNYNFRGMPATVDRLNAASLDKAYNFYKNRFADASNFTFVLVGSFNPELIRPTLETYLGSLPVTNKKESFNNLKLYPAAGQINKTVYKGMDDKAVVQLIFSGNYTYNNANNMQLDALEEVLNIKLIERLREQESGIYSPGIKINYNKNPEARYTATINFTCASANVDKLIAATLDEINKIKQSGAQQTDIDKFKAEEARSTQVQLKQNVAWLGILSSAAQNNEDPEQILSHVKDLDNVTIQSVKETANKYLNTANLAKVILMPEKK